MRRAITLYGDLLPHLGLVLVLVLVLVLDLKTAHTDPVYPLIGLRQVHQQK